MMVHVPAASSVAVLPATVQMPVVEEAKLTGNAEVAVALKDIVIPADWLAIAGNVIVCPEGVLFTITICPTCGAGP